MTNRPLLDWLSHGSTRRGIHFTVTRGDDLYHSYDDLATLTRVAARALVDAGVRPHVVVALVQSSTPAFVASLFGTMLAGGIPAPIPPPPHVNMTGDYWQRLHGLLRVAEASLVVTDAGASEALRSAVSHATPAPAIAADALLANDTRHSIEPHVIDQALLQFTSGSSGRCRAVRVPFAALEANVRMVHRWLHWTELDNAVSWLPVHHDMGLIGCLIGAIVAQCPFWLMAPEQFVRSPLRYLRCLSETRAILTAMPNFALDHIVNRVAPEALHGTDFSACDAVIVGAEPLHARSFEAFCNLLEPFGFRRTALRPAYGLAEATLAVTGLPLREPWTEVDVDPRSLAIGKSIVRVDRSALVRRRFVGCGRPLDGITISIRNHPAEDAEPDGTVGEIVVSGCSIADGYARGADAHETSFVGNALRTGDIGFTLDGQLFVLGRLGDSIKVRGRALFADDVESALAGADLPSHRVAALLGARNGEPTVIVLLERPRDGWIRTAETILRPQIGDAALVVINVPPGTIRRTTSGKIRRQELWRVFKDMDGSTDVKSQDSCTCDDAITVPATDRPLPAGSS